jgi:hypothetical protein
MSLIVELLQYEDNIPDDKAAAHFFEDLSQCNEACESKIDSVNIIDPGNTVAGSVEFMPEIPKKYTRCALVGRQIVSKFSSAK